MPKYNYFQPNITQNRCDKFSLSYGRYKMFLLKIMKKLSILFLISLFYTSFSINLLADDYTISSNSTSTNGGNTINGSDSLLLESGISIAVSGNNKKGITFTGDGNTLNVLGTVTTNGSSGHGIYLNESDNNTITQSGKVKTRTHTSRLYLLEDSHSNDITQSGDLESTGVKWSHCYYLDNADSNNITQTGNCTTAGSTARSHGYFFDDVSGDNSGSDGNTIIQKGNITLTENTNKAYFCEEGTNNSITQSGTITTSGTNGHAYHFYENCDSNTITLSGSISVSGTNAKAIKVESGNDANTLVLSEEPTITGNVDLGSEDFTISLSCDLKKDLTVTLDNKTGMTVTNNLCGNDTYEILDSSLAADADNSETNGYLVIDEGLEVVSNNASYRSENISTKFKGFFNAANYIDGVNSEDKFFRIFYSNVKRENTYKGSMAGVVGQLSPIIWGNVTSHFFLGYNKHYGDFNNGEFLGGDNYALGLKNVFIKNGLKVSFSPMIGLNDLDLTDYDSDSKAKVKTNLLSEFLAVNGKIDKDIKTGEDSSLNLSFQSTFGLQRFPDYLSKFSDGDLSVDEAIEQVLSGGFEVKYNEELGNGFIIKPYAGVTINHNMNDNIDITKDDDYKPASPADTITSGYYAGFTFTRKAKDINLDLDFMYGNEDGLINQIAAISLTKTFGKVKTAKLDKKSDKDIRIVSTMSNQDFQEFGELKELSNKLKIENEQLKIVNEKLKMLTAKMIEEDKASKQLIVELLKENEKIKLEKQIFKNKILENENKELLKEITKGVSKNEVNKFTLLLFVTMLILIAYGLTSFMISIFKVSFKR